MNKLSKIQQTDRLYPLAHPDHAIAVESVTAEGAPYTWACIFRSKHGRSNMVRVGLPHFLCGGRSHRDVVKHAKTRDPADEARYFVERGRLRNIDVVRS